MVTTNGEVWVESVNDAAEDGGAGAPEQGDHVLGRDLVRAAAVEVRGLHPVTHTRGLQDGSDHTAIDMSNYCRLFGSPAVLVKLIHVNDGIVIISTWITFVEDRSGHLYSLQWMTVSCPR